MTATLSSLQTRLSTYLNDATALVYDSNLTTEAIRLALQQMNLVLTTPYTLSGLDGAGSTILPDLDDSLLIIGAASYAAQSRVIKRNESFNLSQDAATSLLTWSADRLEDFKSGLDFLLNQASVAALAGAQLAKVQAQTAQATATAARLNADTSRLTAAAAKFAADNTTAAAEPARLADLRAATVPPFPTADNPSAWLIDDQDNQAIDYLGLSLYPQSGVITPSPSAQAIALFGMAIKTYYRLTETAGSVLRDIIGSHHGTYNGPTLAALNAPFTGDLAPTFDGINDDCDIFAGASSITPSTAGAVLGWAKIPAPVWTDGIARAIVSIYATTGDNIVLKKSTAPNTLDFFLMYGGVSLIAEITYSGADWFSCCLTWDKAANKFDVYINGYNPYVEQTGLGTWTEGYYTAYCRLGGFGGGVDSFKGSASELLFLNRFVTQPEFLAYTQIPDCLKKLTIIGDSIAVQWNQWPFAVAQARGYILKNHAAGGYGILNNGLTLETALAATDDADIIILALGTKDDNAGSMATLTASIQTHIAALKAANPSAVFYWLNVLPKWTDNTGSTPVVLTNVRAAIAAACAALGITRWDSFSTPWITASQTADGTHPTTAGQAAIVAQVLARLP
jgi:hypothetical protein